MLSPLSVVASAPLWITGLVVNEPAAFRGPTALAQTFAIATLGYLAMALIMLTADRLPVVRRLTGLRASIIVIVVIAVATEARLAIVLVGFELNGLPDDVPLAVRAISSALLGVAAFGYAGVAHSAWASYRLERDRLVLSLLRATHRAEGHEAAVAAMSSMLRETIRSRLAEARPAISYKLEALKQALLSGEDGRPELERLTSVTDARWRAISAEAWKRFTPELNQVGFREFAWAYSLTRPFSLTSMLLGAGALTFFVFARTQALSQGAASLAVWLVGTVVVAVIANSLVTRAPRAALNTVIAAFAVLASYPLWLVLLGVVRADDAELIIRIGVINLHVLAVMVLAGASPAIALNRDAVLSSLRRRRDRTSVQQLQLESRLLGTAHELAATLHGASRTAFMAEALRLEAALDRGDRAAAIALVEEVRATIFDAERSIDARPRPIAVSDIEEVIDGWRSLCTIDVLGSWHHVPAALLPAVHTVVVEGISDAMRHGDCSHLQIEVRSAAAGIDLSLTNDGEPIDPHAPAGLGTALLDQLAPGRWSREVDRMGLTRLAVALR
ncbi:hypothetical protein [Microcella sp.]|uniref:hypothetical protein n=1 Tax=Microcella sp. TaxID=1913979 RepID=UPI00256B96B1|nr:hypothetical protein [Microcella sp.]MBX9472883.1 hypothetical protein [Microcella sp.]